MVSWFVLLVLLDMCSMWMRLSFWKYLNIGVCVCLFLLKNYILILVWVMVVYRNLNLELSILCLLGLNLRGCDVVFRFFLVSFMSFDVLGIFLFDIFFMYVVIICYFFLVFIGNKINIVYINFVRVLIRRWILFGKDFFFKWLVVV